MPSESGSNDQRIGRNEFLKKLPLYLLSGLIGGAGGATAYRARSGGQLRREFEEGYRAGHAEALRTTPGDLNPVRRIEVTVDSDKKLYNLVATRESGDGDFFDPFVVKPSEPDGFGFQRYVFDVRRSAPPSPDDRRSEPEEKQKDGYPVRTV